MNSTDEKPKRSRTEIKPTEIDRWEGEGGNPPNARVPKDPAPKITGILRRLLVDWHLINAHPKT